MTLWKSYHLAQSIADALHALDAAPGPARILGGGSDLLLDLQQGRQAPVHTLVDVSQVPELTVLEIRGGELFIGAAYALNRIVAHPLIGEHARALQEACALVGGPQVRNSATLGGNVAHALPAADGTIALFACGAEAEVAGMAGCARRPLESLFLGPGRSALDPRGELLVGFYLPLRPAGSASAFRRVMRPQGVALPILNMAAWVQRDGERIGDLRLAAGPSGPTPQRLAAVEAALRGQVFSPQTLETGYQALLESVHFRTSPQRASAEYRRQLSCSLLYETLETAWQRTAF